MVDLDSLNAATTARKEAEARAARKAYEKRKTRAAQVTALLEGTVQAAAAPLPMAPATPQRQTIETAPGDAEFRAGLLPFCFPSFFFFFSLLFLERKSAPVTGES
jgi:hypothetical protein